MVQYEGHAIERDGCSVEGDFVSGPGSPGAPGDQTDYARSLLTLIEGEIIPRLMVAHASLPPMAAPTEGTAVIEAGELEAFGPLVLQVEVDALLLHVEAILARGVAIDTVLVDLLAPTARQLGAFWEDERCEFVDVTMGLWRLQEIVNEISQRLPAERRPPASNRCAFLGPNPGDQRCCGTVAVDDRFRRDGGLPDRLSAAENADLQRRLADDWFGKLGLTDSNDCHIGQTRPMTAALRSVSRNPQC